MSGRIPLNSVNRIAESLLSRLDILMIEEAKKESLDLSDVDKVRIYRRIIVLLSERFAPTERMSGQFPLDF